MRISTVFLAILSSILCRDGPPQPPSFNPDVNKTIKKDEFKRYEQEIGQSYNKYIPERSDLRIVTWNVHMLTDVYGEQSNVEQVVGVLDRLHPDIVVMQEIPTQGLGVNRTQQLLSLLPNYHHAIAESGDPEGELGIMVMSKYPIDSINTVQLGYKRVVLDACIIVKDQELHVLGTHLEVSDAKVRKRQAEQIIAYVEDRKYPSFLVMGDFNSIWDGPEMEPWKSWPEAAETFRTLDWQPPSYTVWSGAQIDYVFASWRLLGGRLTGAYVYHDGTASDHLAVITDIEFAEDGLSVLLIVIGVAVFLLGLIYMAMPSDAWRNAYRALNNEEMALWTDIYDD